MSSAEAPPGAPTKGLSLGLVGQRIHYSLSPQIHHAALENVGLTGTYKLIDIDGDQLAEVVEQVRRGELDGVNITTPHKERAFELADQVEASTAVLRAINTLYRNAAGEVVGANTDVSGLTRVIHNVNLATPPHIVCVLGAGGAARAAVMSALEVGAREVRVWNRTPSRARALVNDLIATAEARDAELHAMGSTATAARDANLIIHATSRGTAAHGMAYREVRRWASRCLETAPDGATIVDLVYRPYVTAWVRAAGEQGLFALSGLSMLVHQAADAFERWTGRAPDRNVLLEAAEAELATKAVDPAVTEA